MLDLTHARVVEIVWDATHRRLWINTEDGCIARIYNVAEFHFRASPIPDEPENRREEQ